MPSFTLEPTRQVLKALQSTVALWTVAFAVVGCLVLAPSASAMVISPGFAGPALDQGLIASGSAGTGFMVGGGTLTLSQAPGEGNGGISVSTALPMSGDFVATVTAVRTGLGRADLGLALGTADWTYTLADVFFNDLAGTVNGNIFQPAFTGAFLPNLADTLSLTITRSGDTITDAFDNGSGPVIINFGSNPALSGPVNIALFLLEAAGDTGSHSGTFTHFQVTPTVNNGITEVSEPTTLTVLGASIFVLGGAVLITGRNTVGSVEKMYPCRHGRG